MSRDMIWVLLWRCGAAGKAACGIRAVESLTVSPQLCTLSPVCVCVRACVRACVCIATLAGAGEHVFDAAAATGRWRLLQLIACAKLQGLCCPQIGVAYGLLQHGRDCVYHAAAAVLCIPDDVWHRVVLVSCLEACAVAQTALTACMASCGLARMNESGGTRCSTSSGRAT
jgi:hypothetical protein